MEGGGGGTGGEGGGGGQARLSMVTERRPLRESGGGISMIDDIGTLQMFTISLSLSGSDCITVSAAMKYNRHTQSKNGKYFILAKLVFVKATDLPHSRLFFFFFFFCSPHCAPSTSFLIIADTPTIISRHHLPKNRYVCLIFVLFFTLVH